MGSEANTSFSTSSWDVLPQHIMVSIFSYLTHAERVPAALTCKNWNSCLQHPLLWHHFVCKFVSPKNEKVLEAIEQHGHQIRDLVIEVDQGESLNRTNACKVLNNMAMNQARKLSSLTVNFLGLNPLFYAGHEFIVELKLLFGGNLGSNTDLPSRLTHVDLSGLTVALDDSLLNMLSDKHPGLQFLNIQNKSLVCKVSSHCIRHLVTQCEHLKDLRVYDLSMTDDVLKAIVDQNEPCLQHLSIVHRRETKYTIELSSEAWQQLITKIPTLRVTLGFDHTCPFNRICEVMKPEIPVTELRLETFTRIYEEVNHATNCYHRTLEKLVLQTRNSEELGKALVRLAENCTHLNSLLVYCVLNEAVITRILELRPEIKQKGRYILKSTLEEGPWVVGVETDEEAQERLLGDT